MMTHEELMNAVSDTKVKITAEHTEAYYKYFGHLDDDGRNKSVPFRFRMKVAEEAKAINARAIARLSNGKEDRVQLACGAWIDHREKNNHPTRKKWKELIPDGMSAKECFMVLGVRGGIDGLTDSIGTKIESVKDYEKEIEDDIPF